MIGFIDVNSQYEIENIYINIIEDDDKIIYELRVVETYNFKIGQFEKSSIRNHSFRLTQEEFIKFSNQLQNPIA